MLIPVITSMPAISVLPTSSLNYGFIGAYGDRAANFIIAKSDCILSMGSRLDIRQTGANISTFAPNAMLYRVDVDEAEFTNRIKDDEVQIKANLKTFLPELLAKQPKVKHGVYEWINICNLIRKNLIDLDKQPVNDIINAISHLIEPQAVVTTDVGQNQVWIAQSFYCAGQNILFSSGHGAMGYSLPAAIGAWYGTNKPVYSFNGDGGFQMNIQELQFVVRENIPLRIIVLNNKSLGMIRHFQEMYFNGTYTMTKNGEGYLSPDFNRIAKAYGIKSAIIKNIDDIHIVYDLFSHNSPVLLEILLDDDTYVYPKLAMGKPNQDQEPPISRNLYDYLQNL